MLDKNLLVWLQDISSWYIILPLLIVILRWKQHDVIRRRVSWYVFFNISVTGLAYVIPNNWYLFYLTPPIFVWIVFKIYEPQIGSYKIWNLIKYLVIGFAVYAIIDMIWIEWGKFPENIYPVQSIVILFVVYYFLYIFSKEARKDFSSLWISIGIGISALLIFIVLVYFPYLGFKPNTFGYFLWMGLGSVSTILTYSCISYGLWIARPR